MLTINKEAFVSTTGARPRVQPPASNVGNPDPNGAPAQFASQAMNLPEDYDDDAFTNTRLRMDVNSIKGFCNRLTATVVSVKNGDWDDPLTWYNTVTMLQQVPVAGDKVLLSLGTVVTYNQNNDTEYKWIRADGELIFDATINTKLVVETLFGDHTSITRLGTKVSPLPSNLTCLLEYPDNGDMDVSSDPFKMQRGFISFGRVLMYGAPKKAFEQVAAGADVGATSVTLNGAATGWEVGDEILIPGTRMKGFSGNTWEPWENEVRILTGIDNTAPSAPILSWTTPLVYPHLGCHLRTVGVDFDQAFQPHIANLTRNFKSYTAGSDPLPKHRGHQLWKNNDGNEIEYLETRKCGRTDMDVKNGFEPVDLMEFITGGGTVDADTNTTGRYSFHFHRNGANDPNTPLSILRGCVGVDAPGWMFTHHDSHGDMIDCIAYDYQSVGFSGEGGGTFGEMNGCFACGSRHPEAVLEGSKLKDGGKDIGTVGHGFWTNSRPLKFKNCVGCNNQSGLFWTSRVSFDTNVYPGITDEIRAFYGLAALGNDVNKAFAVIEGFENNTAYACLLGGVVAKKLPIQHHNLRSFLNGFNVWEVDTGFHWQYTAAYSMANFDLVGFDNSHRTGSPNNPGIGFDVFRQSGDMILVQPKAQNFARGVSYTQASGDNYNTRMNNKVVLPTTFVDCTNDYYAGSATGKPAIPDLQLPWDALGNGNVDVEEVTQTGPGGAGSITTTYTEDISYWTGSGNFTIAMDHSYTDSLGTIERYFGIPLASLGIGDTVNGQEETRDVGTGTKIWGQHLLIQRIQMEQMIRAEGVYTSAAGDKVLLIPDVIQDRADGTTTYFWTPVALRMPTSQFNNLNPPDNGVLGIHDGQNFTSFNPAGTPGLLP